MNIFGVFASRKPWEKRSRDNERALGISKPHVMDAFKTHDVV